MERSALFWFILTMLCILAEGFFAMGEIAIISFNKVRLHYYVNKKIKRAEWINELLQNPSRLFGTVLLGVNIALQVGSECSRQFYVAAGLNPDFAFVSQFVLVVVIAELAPLFAGRRYAEHASMLQVPVIYGASKVMAPVIWLFSLSVKAMNKLFHSHQEELGSILSREELQKIVEEQDDTTSITAEKEEFNVIVGNIFHLRTKIAKQVMVPLVELKMVPNTCSVGDLRLILKETPHSNIPIYHRNPANVVAITSPRDLVRIPDNKNVREFARPPWFITEETTVTEILNQFRRNGQNAAIVLDEKGKAQGLITLDDILDEIFHEEKESELLFAIVDKTFPGQMSIAEFNKEFKAHLEGREATTLEELISRHLEHHPVEGDKVRIENFELTVEESSLLGIKSVSVRTLR
ncbi:MAG: hemolysin family protein [Chlamydiales bacterium]|nr:hemolysin family protein [Chlamydiales bacterium]